jgi:hypothetical protein
MITAATMKHLLPVGLLILGLAVGCEKKSGASNAASLEELNRALAVVAMRSGYSPPPTNEVAKFLALSGKTPPTPPPGKKLVIDPAGRQFVFVDQ